MAHAEGTSLNRVATSATTHCLTGCGIGEFSGSEEQYSYNVRYNLRRLTHAVETGQGGFVVHPGFRKALSIGG
jgi:hypothetical protein